MRPERAAFLLLIVLAAPTLAAPETGSAFERSIERLVATPTPVGPLLLGSDQSTWRVDVPLGAIVTVEANGTPTAPFYLRARTMGAAESSFALPTSHAGFFLAGPESWQVSVDPVAGVAVDITIRFRGHVGDATGAPALFTLTPITIERGCLFPSVCLP